LEVRVEENVEEDFMEDVGEQIASSHVARFINDTSE